jgi:hypothetical protein
MQRILAYVKAAQHQAVSVNFQSAEAEFLNNLDLFLHWFCASVSDALGLDERLEEHCK